MASKTAPPVATTVAPEKKSSAPPRPFPTHSLEEALVIMQAIESKGASRKMDRLLVAEAVGRTPSSSEFRLLLSSSLRYGLTSGTEKADYIEPTGLGLKIVKPETPQKRVDGLVEAALRPDLMGKILRHYNRAKFPEAGFLKNTLERTFEVDPRHSLELSDRLSGNARYCGILQNISGSDYIRIEDPVAVETAERAISMDDVATPEIDPPTGKPEDRPIESDRSVPEKPKQLFVAHGKNHKPLEELKKVLSKFGIAFKVAVDEPHAGRPISAKVAGLMKECSAGIFIFTKDEKFIKEEKGENIEIWRPSENVVYELGAASVLYDKNIILREEGVTFPSDFSDLGYITFSDDISTRGMELLGEFVALGLVKIQAV